MKQVLVTFGDSWPKGAELGNGKRYGEILLDQMAFDQFYNYGSGGASNEDMMYQFQRHLAEVHQHNHSTTAIFFLTNPARTAHFPRFFSWHDAPMTTKTKELYLHFHTSEHEIMRSSAAVSALQMWCKSFGIRDYYFSGWVRYPEWLPGVDLDRIWAQGKETAADWFGASDHNGEHLVNVENNPYIRPNFAHPNQQGHQLIADRLQRWIESTP
jgi:hypothetical protein